MLKTILSVLAVIAIAAVSAVDGRDEVRRHVPVVSPLASDAINGTTERLSIASFENGLWRVRMEDHGQVWPGRLRVQLPDGTLVADVRVPVVDASARWFEGVFFQAPEGAGSLILDDGFSTTSVSVPAAGGPSVTDDRGDVPSVAGTERILGSDIVELSLLAPSGFLAVELQSRPALTAAVVGLDGQRLPGFEEIAPNLWIWYGAAAEAPATVRLRVKTDLRLPGTVALKLTDQHGRVVHTRVRIPSSGGDGKWTALREWNSPR